MIDFRYHVVSIVAVFLALALGLVLGSTALRGPLLSSLSGNVKTLTSDNQRQRQQARDAQRVADRQGEFVEAAAPALLGDSLAGKAVAVVSLPGASSDEEKAVRAYLKTAGASTPAVLRISEEFLDPKRGGEIKDLVSRLLPPGVTTPTDDDGVAQGAALVGAVVSGRQRSTAISAATRTSVLQGFSNLGLLSTDGDVTGAAEQAVVLGGATGTGEDARAALEAGVTAVTQLDKVLPQTVVAAPNGTDTVVTELRKDSAVRKTVSTVDDSDAVIGQVSTVLALVAEARNSVGAYGVGSGASPAPTAALR